MGFDLSFQWITLAPKLSSVQLELIGVAAGDLKGGGWTASLNIQHSIHGVDVSPLSIG